MGYFEFPRFEPSPSRVFPILQECTFKISHHTRTRVAQPDFWKPSLHTTFPREEKTPFTVTTSNSHSKNFLSKNVSLLTSQPINTPSQNYLTPNTNTTYLQQREKIQGNPIPFLAPIHHRNPSPKGRVYNVFLPVLSLNTPYTLSFS